MCEPETCEPEDTQTPKPRRSSRQCKRPENYFSEIMKTSEVQAFYYDEVPEDMNIEDLDYTSDDSWQTQQQKDADEEEEYEWSEGSLTDFIEPNEEEEEKDDVYEPVLFDD